MSAIYRQAATMWHEMRAEFELTLEAAYAKAEGSTNACMLNARGWAEGIDPYSLLTGPYVRVQAFGSPELIEHFGNVGRPSLERFEREWLESYMTGAA